MKEILGTIFCTATAIIGYHMHHSVLLAIIDFVLAPLVWIKWLVFHEVTLTIIRESFAWFLR